MTKKNKTKALALLSGGLDSILAIKLIQKQGVNVIGINFSSPFFSEKNAIEAAKQLKIKLVKVDLNKSKNLYEYLKIIKKPKHGYGSAINPCIDCRIFMLKKAKALMKKFKAKFVVTGEVLNERPMSQNLGALKLVEKESGLQGKLLRPLSAKLLPETEVEKKKIVNRSKLFDIQGRSRHKQIELAKKFRLSYPTPAGGCLLCEKEFAKKLKDLFEYKKRIEPRDIELLKIGRHFRVGNNKIIVGRNEQENKKLVALANKDFIFETKDFPSPITLLQGKATRTTIEIAAALTVSYSDAKNSQVQVTVNYGKGKFNKCVRVNLLDKEKIEKLRIK